MNKSLNYRKDQRTLLQFEKDILDNTKKEKFLLSIFVKELKKKGHKVRVKNFGIDNTGKFIVKSNCKADYQITIDGVKGLYEIKNSPVDWKMTYKVYDLQQYIKNSVNIIIFYGTGFLNDNPKKINLKYSRYGIITPEKIQLMLKNCESYIEKAFGYKECIKVDKKDFNLYLECHEITILDQK